MPSWYVGQSLGLGCFVHSGHGLTSKCWQSSRRCGQVPDGGDEQQDGQHLQVDISRPVEGRPRPGSECWTRPAWPPRSCRDGRGMPDPTTGIGLDGAERQHLRSPLSLLPVTLRGHLRLESCPDSAPARPVSGASLLTPRLCRCPICRIGLFEQPGSRIPLRLTPSRSRNGRSGPGDAPPSLGGPRHGPVLARSPNDRLPESVGRRGWSPASMIRCHGARIRLSPASDHPPIRR
jgi:hypothetical protein